VNHDTPADGAPNGPNLITPTKAPRVSHNTAMAAAAPPRVHQQKKIATQAPKMYPLVPTATVADVTVAIRATPLDLANGVFDHDSGKTLEYR
jgi:hypothetical protein